MRQFVRPAVAALSIACLAVSITAVTTTGALAQAKQQMAPAPQVAPPAVKQMALTEKQVQGVLAAQKDMDAIIAERAVVRRWADYRGAFDTALGAYREVYADLYQRVRKAAEETLAAIQEGAAYGDAPAGERDRVVAKVFGPGRPCHYEALTVGSIEGLLDAAAKRSLTSLDTALVALPGYRAQVEAELAGLSHPVDVGGLPRQAPAAERGEKVFRWRPGTALAGKRFRTQEDVDRALGAVREELEARLREGFTIVVVD